MKSCGKGGKSKNWKQTDVLHDWPQIVLIFTNFPSKSLYDWEQSLTQEFPSIWAQFNHSKIPKKANFSLHLLSAPLCSDDIFSVHFFTCFRVTNSAEQSTIALTLHLTSLSTDFPLSSWQLGAPQGFFSTQKLQLLVIFLWQSSNTGWQREIFLWQLAFHWKNYGKTLSFQFEVLDSNPCKEKGENFGFQSHLLATLDLKQARGLWEHP